MESERVTVRGVKLTNKMNEECTCAYVYSRAYNIDTSPQQTARDAWKQNWIKLRLTV